MSDRLAQRENTDQSGVQNGRPPCPPKRIWRIENAGEISVQRAPTRGDSRTGFLSGHSVGPSPQGQPRYNALFTNQEFRIQSEEKNDCPRRRCAAGINQTGLPVYPTEHSTTLLKFVKGVDKLIFL